MTRHTALLLLPLFLLLVLPSVHAWAYNGWQYHVPITISNPNASTLTDFQVKITVDTASLISAGKMNSDCSDMRFADALDNPLPYWIESGCNTSSTVVWVKVPSIPANGSTTIYMYYGNPNATSESDGDAVFEFFDDFDDGIINTSKWATTGTVSEDGVLSVGGDGKLAKVQGLVDFSSAVVVTAKLYSDGTGMLFGLSDATTTDAASNMATFYQYPTTNTTELSIKINGTIYWHNTGTLYTGWHIVEIAHTGSGTEMKIDGTSVATGENPPFPLHVIASNWSSNVLELDYVFVRKYAPSEPTATFGAEEMASVGVSVTLTHSPTAQSDLALDPENNITSITVDYNAVFNKTNATVTYYRAYDGDTNTTIVEGNQDVNYITFSRTYDAIGDYNTCVYVKAVDDGNNTYEHTACDVVHIDEYPQGLSFDWNNYIPFPNDVIKFSGEANDNGTVMFTWDFGDGNTLTSTTIHHCEGALNPVCYFITTAMHSYTSAGTYTVVMTVTDDVGLSKSTSVSVPVYSIPDLNWVPVKPHAQEPTTIKVVYDPRLDVNNTTWTVPDSIVVDQNMYATTAKFQHYGVKTVNATVTLTDGTNVRDYNLTADINVIPIKWTVLLKDEATNADFNLSTVTAVDVSVLDEANELFRDTYTTTSKTYELNYFPTDITAYVSFGGGSYYRKIRIYRPDYEMNVPIYLVEPTNPLLQIVFIPSASDVVVTVKRNGRYVHGAKPSIDGAVATYLVRDVAYSVGYVCPDGEEHIIGIYQPITATTVSLQTSCGTVSAYPSEMMKGINFSAYYDKDLHSIIVEYSDDTNGTDQACVHISGNGTDYYECATSFPAKFTYIVPQDVNMAVYQVTLTVTHSKYGQFTLSDWVGVGVKFPIPGVPPFVYPWLALIPAIAFILGATALHSRLAPILGVLWLGFATWAEWVSLPVGGALISFLLFLLVVTWRQEGRP